MATKEYSGKRVSNARAIAQRQLPTACYLCGGLVTADMRWVAEHKIPRALAKQMGMSAFEQDSPDNIGVSHLSCSNKSGGKLSQSVFRSEPKASDLSHSSFLLGSSTESSHFSENSEIPPKRQFWSIENDSGEFLAIPRYYSLSPEDEPDIDISGAELIAEKHLTPLGDKPHSFKPQQKQIARVLEAKEEEFSEIPRFQRVVIQVPRRSAKTETIQAVLFNRCLTIPGYTIIQTAQTYMKARQTFLRMIRTLEQTYEENPPFVAKVGMGSEMLIFENGSVWSIATPKASAYRGDPADCLWFDEAGTYSEEQSKDLEEGAVPTQDTKPRAQMIVSGTPEIRGGMLWDSLTVARANPEENGILDYSMETTDDPEDEDLWYRIHPGLASGLTTIKVIRQRFDRYPLSSFMQEYLCADPLSSKEDAIPEEDWLATLQPEAEVPDYASYGYATSYPHGTYAALVAAWYSEDGIPHISLVQHDTRAKITQRVAALLKENPRAVVHFDAIGDNISIANDLKRIPKLPTANLSPISVKQVSAGVSTLINAITDRRLHHSEQKPLQVAAKGATFRIYNDSRLFGRKSSIEDISPLEAAAIALEDASQKIPKAKVRIQATTL